RTYVPGPSPRVRGRVKTDASSWTVTGVHPRACGGENRLQDKVVLQPGPSPRVRGRGAVQILSALDDGSIPARAGERSPGASRATCWRVHPRACGGESRAPRAITS